MRYKIKKWITGKNEKSRDRDLAKVFYALVLLCGIKVIK